MCEREEPDGRRYMALIEDYWEHSRKGDLDFHALTDLWEEAEPIMNDMIALQNLGNEFEKQGDVEQAMAIYQSLVEEEFHHPGPFERLRVL